MTHTKMGQAAHIIPSHQPNIKTPSLWIKRQERGLNKVSGNVRKTIGDGHCALRALGSSEITVEAIMQERHAIGDHIGNNLSNMIYGTTDRTFYKTILEQQEIEPNEHTDTTIAKYLWEIKNTSAHLGYIELDAYAKMNMTNLRIYTQGEQPNTFIPRSQVIVTTEAITKNNTKYLLWSGIENVTSAHYDELVNVEEIEEQTAHDVNTFGPTTHSSRSHDKYQDGIVNTRMTKNITEEGGEIRNKGKTLKRTKPNESENNKSDNTEKETKKTMKKSKVEDVKEYSPARDILNDNSNETANNKINIKKTKLNETEFMKKEVNHKNKEHEPKEDKSITTETQYDPDRDSLQDNGKEDIKNKIQTKNTKETESKKKKDNTSKNDKSEKGKNKQKRKRLGSQERKKKKNKEYGKGRQETRLNKK
jgi:hypothetical protein